MRTTDRTVMRLLRLSFVGLLIGATPAAANPPFPLAPFGLPYSPEAPVPLPADHPLYRKVAIDPIVGMPEKVGAFLAPITKRVEMDEAIRETLDKANMLAPAGTPPKFRLSVRWVSFFAPQKISFSSEASAEIAYTLTRIDSGAQIFTRIIRTAATARGGDGTARLQGNARMALTTNLASAWVCMDKAAYGNAPADCALTALARFQAPRPPIIIFGP